VRELDGEAYVDAWVNPYYQSDAVNKALAKVLDHGPYDVVHFNIGLHGWNEGRIKPSEFQPLTRAYVEVLKSKLPDAKLIWASSTPVTIVSDFYGLLVNRRELARGDSFHWREPAYQILGHQASQSIRDALNNSGDSQ
jgi:hypothetical protein